MPCVSEMQFCAVQPMPGGQMPWFWPVTENEDCSSQWLIEMMTDGVMVEALGLFSRARAVFGFQLSFALAATCHVGWSDHLWFWKTLLFENDIPSYTSEVLQVSCVREQNQEKQREEKDWLIILRYMWDKEKKKGLFRFLVPLVCPLFCRSQSSTGTLRKQFPIDLSFKK